MGTMQPYKTKVCPRCGAELYADMSVCYGCLYDFSHERPPAPAEAPPGSAAREALTEDTRDLSSPPPPGSCRRDEPGLVIRTAVLDVWAAVPREGFVLGRDPSCDVVLHSPAVSRRHLRVTPVPEGMEVVDLGATNPATYRGREVCEPVVVPYGESVDLCGTALLATGPSPS